MEAYRQKMADFKKSEKYLKYHGPDPIRTKPYNYEQLCIHEQDYHKALHFYNIEQKQKEKEYQETYVKNRPKEWKVKPNPNRWFSNGNMNSFHKEAPRFKNPGPQTIFKNYDNDYEFVYEK